MTSAGCGGTLHNVTTRASGVRGALRVAAMSTQTPPDTIVLIHGFWVTPRSWEEWIAHYETKGFTVLAPAYPGFEVEVEALNADPTPDREGDGRRRSWSVWRAWSGVSIDRRS